MDFEEKEKYNVYDLVEIVKILRAPDGCPWDKEQTHKSIRQEFIEETYEVVEAIDKESMEMLREELGDVLLQVVFHSVIEQEQGNFDIDDVADEVCKKMIIRHPHIFGDVKADTTEQVLTNWDNIKMQTKSQKSQSEVLDGISKALPSLMRSQKIQKKASKVGFDWDSIDGAFDKLEEEIAELKQAVANGNSENIADEMGDVLFSAVNVSRFAHTDAEEALYNACEKFISRFTKMEKLADERNISMSNSSLDELDSLWNEAKKNETL